VVWDSDAAREYAECLAKAEVLLAESPEFELITALRWEPGVGCALWERHALRLQRAAEYFGRPFDPDAARRALEAAAAGFPPGPRRVRLRVSESGACAVEDAPAPTDAPARIAVAARPMDVDTPFVFHKTTHRDFYDAARASRPDADDVLLWNPRGEITETTIANAAFYRDGRWVTPPIACGLLGGVMREELLARGEWIEGPIPKSDVRSGETIELANAVRGRWTARIVE
jgi:para-aminobenzoate synthetase/4-amino-4-deoxychorismate lyase